MDSPNTHHGSQISELDTLNSLYNITFYDVQTQLGKLGKTLNTMDFDLSAKNVISTEEDQLIQNAYSPSSSSGSTLFGNVNLNQTPISKKTIDEVWKEVVHQQHVNSCEKNSVQEQMAFGEITLEEFLVRVGIDPQPLMGIDPMVVKPFISISEQSKFEENSDWLSTNGLMMPIQAVVDSNFQGSELGFENPMVDVSNPDNHLALPMPMPMPMHTLTATSSESHMGIDRKSKFKDERMEKSIERRQKRMIKNRESAARSRARKQDYTNKLEQKVSLLRDKNKRLKKQKDLSGLSNLGAAHALRYQLRRTSSATV